MKLTWVGLVLALSVQADTVHLTNGKSVTGRVVGYSRMTFEVADEQGAVARHAQAMVKRIEFTGGEASITTINRGLVRGQLTGYENSQFILKTANGEERIATAMIRKVNFGGGDARAVAQVTGRDLSKHIVAGKVTIVDFYADWCGPCRKIGPVLETMARNDPDVVLRKVDVDQNTALAKQYGAKRIPLILVFDKTGKEIGKITGADEEGVKRLVAQAKGS